MEDAIAFKEKHRLHYQIEVSAKTGAGIKELVEMISKNLYHINKENLENFKEGGSGASGTAANKGKDNDKGSF